jgi:hypothetical protein
MQIVEDFTTRPSDRRNCPDPPPLIPKYCEAMTKL